MKSNSFVANLASVLNINPERLRVVNIVPGNRRRRLGGTAKRIILEDVDNDDGITVTWELSEEGKLPSPFKVIRR